MSSNWDREMAKIDKQLASISDEELRKSSAPPPVRAAGRQAPAATVTAAAASPGRRTRGWAVYLRVLIGVALGVGILFWPKAVYPIACGPNLFLYLGATALISVTGFWGALWTWRHRAGAAHVVSLLTMVWGLVLGATEVLPRVGYAQTDVTRPATWFCP
ncbi:MAG: hypothetical protein WKG32_03085 [Gemmatimonadaceae bacterium]